MSSLPIVGFLSFCINRPACSDMLSSSSVEPSSKCTPALEYSHCRKQTTHTHFLDYATLNLQIRPLILSCNSLFHSASLQEEAAFTLIQKPPLTHSPPHSSLNYRNAHHPQVMEGPKQSRSRLPPRLPPNDTPSPSTTTPSFSRHSRGHPSINMDSLPQLRRQQKHERPRARRQPRHP